MSEGYTKSDLVDMAETWNTFVNGTTIPPKIAAQLRVYRQQWEKGQQIKTALATTAPGVAKLQGLLQSSAEAVESPPRRCRQGSQSLHPKSLPHPNTLLKAQQPETMQALKTSVACCIHN